MMVDGGRVTGPLTTEGLKGERAFRRWQAIADEVIDVDVVGVHSLGDFRGSLGGATLGPAVLFDVRTQGASFSVERGRQRLTRETTEICGIVGTISGGSVLRQAGRELEYGPRDLIFARGDSPLFHTVPRDCHDLAFLVPAAVLQSHATSSASLFREPHLIQPSPMRDLCFDYLSALAVRASDLTPGEGALATSLALELLAALLAPDSAGDHRRAVRVAVKQRILRSIDLAIGHPLLGPTFLAAKHHLSLRYLHGLFEDGESVGRTILHRRLDLCRAMLESPEGARLTIAQIAERHGFVSGAHFSHAFKARFGMTPRDARRDRR
jgi:AraC-like DNA-binding protein